MTFLDRGTNTQDPAVHPGASDAWDALDPGAPSAHGQTGGNALTVPTREALAVVSRAAPRMWGNAVNLTDVSGKYATRIEGDHEGRAWLTVTCYASGGTAYNTAVVLADDEDDAIAGRGLIVVANVAGSTPLPPITLATEDELWACVYTGNGYLTTATTVTVSYTIGVNPTSE